jgi:hypothetical protein
MDGVLAGIQCEGRWFLKPGAELRGLQDDRKSKVELPLNECTKRRSRCETRLSASKMTTANLR